MCVGIPGKVTSIKGKKVKVDQGDHSHWVGIDLIEEKIKLGDYLLTYQDTAINKISTKEAEEVLSLIGASE